MNTAIEIINEFCDKKLNGKIENLSIFCFADILNDKDFSGGSSHCDSTKIARAIYSVVYDIPYNDIGSNGTYGGDTLNTFNTLLSSKLGNELLEKSIEELNKMTSLNIYNGTKNPIAVTGTLVKKITDFSRTYLTVGNFMPMPKVRGSTINTTLNMYRGSNCGFAGYLYADYFDTFLNGIHKCFLNTEDKDPYLYDLYTNNNDFFYINDKTIKSFCEKYYLDGYVEIKSKLFRASVEGKCIDTEVYLAEVERYIDGVSTIIQRRGEQFVEKFYSLLSMKRSNENIKL